MGSLGVGCVRRVVLLCGSLVRVDIMLFFLGWLIGGVGGLGFIRMGWGHMGWRWECPILIKTLQ